MSDDSTQSGGSPGAEGTVAQPVLGAPASTNGATGKETPAPGTTVSAEGAKDQVPPPDPAADAAAKAKADETAKAAEAKKAEETKAAEAKKAEETKAAFEKSWTEFKPKRAEGVEVDEATQKQALAGLKEAGLSPEQAQKVIELNDKLTLAAGKESLAKFKAERDGWLQNTTKRIAGTDAGKKLGTDKAVMEATKQANRALEKYAPKGFVEFIRATGFDGHDGLFELLQNVGAAMKDDSIAGAVPGNGAGELNEEARLRVLYPSMYPKS